MLLLASSVGPYPCYGCGPTAVCVRMVAVWTDRQVSGKVYIVARIVAAVRSDVANARKRSGLTQAKLARLVGVSRQTVVEVEAGGYNPSVALALRLAVVLDTTVDDLFALPESEVAALLGERAAPGA